jgi:hypothetical protein
MRSILTLILTLTTLYSLAGGLDSTSIMLNHSTNKEINLHLRTNDKELSSNGFLTAVGGLGFITTGLLLEQKRIQQNIPDGHNGYSKSKDIGLNYFITSLGASMTITGVIMIRKAYKK